jgi:hypothetical protein
MVVALRIQGQRLVNVWKFGHDSNFGSGTGLGRAKYEGLRGRKVIINREL